MSIEAQKPLTAFVASSSESKDIAEGIFANLAARSIEVTPWWERGFGEPTSTVFDDLVLKAGRFDFGIFVFAADDITEVRQTSMRSVRDNVLFELGLFIGVLGAERAFIMAPEVQEMHLPTDLEGRNLVKFPSRYDKKWTLAVAPACNQVAERMVKLGHWSGVRYPTNISESEEKDLTLPPPERIIVDRYIRGARLLVINDNILEASTEIVASSDDNHFSARGGVSRDILQKVGPDVRFQLDYYKKLERFRFQQGQVVITTGGQWKRKAIIHAAVIDLEEKLYPTFDSIRVVTRGTLECARALGGRSIALPVFGGGYATKKLSASDSVNAVASEILEFIWARDIRAESLKHIELYIFNRPDAAGLPDELKNEEASSLV
jgi:O-acetyl-ADP-ribose deacetylase (regulator of RNase III)